MKAHARRSRVLVYEFAWCLIDSACNVGVRYEETVLWLAGKVTASERVRKGENDNRAVLLAHCHRCAPAACPTQRPPTRRVRILSRPSSASDRHDCLALHRRAHQ